jgi:hypothetical protein
MKSSRKRGRRDTLRVTHNSDGQELWEVSSEDYSYSDSGSPAPKARKHGCHDKITMLQDLNGNEVFDLSEEEYSYSESD